MTENDYNDITGVKPDGDPDMWASGPAPRERIALVVIPGSLGEHELADELLTHHK